MSANPASLMKTFTGFVQLCRFDKPVGILLLLWPTLWALLDAAQGVPAPWVLTVFVLGVILMRSAGCVINDYADRHWDGAVERTKQRPLVTGTVKPWQALSLFGLLCAIALGLVLTLNPLTIQLSLAAAALATVYPFTKRYTQLPQFVLGTAFSWAIPMAYAAVQNQVPMHAWALFAANLSWTVAYDTQYAMVDRDDDLKVGIKSTAILFGQWDRQIIALLQLLCLLSLAWFAQAQHYGMVFWGGLLIVSALFMQQAWQIRSRERAACFAAFKANNRVGLVLTLAIAASLLLDSL